MAAGSAGCRACFLIYLPDDLLSCRYHVADGPGMKAAPDLLDPVVAYDFIADYYGELAARRRQYLAAVEDAIVSRIPTGASSMLDIGAGDGARADRIARRAGIRKIVLLEPTAALRAKISFDAEIWPIRGEELNCYLTANRSFDVITCLWNVFGHLRTAKDRSEVLTSVANLLTPRDYSS